MGREPLYPHVPKSRTAKAKVVEELQPGQVVRLRSGTEGWIRATVVEYADIVPTVGGVIYTGPSYKVRPLEGKHKGEIIRMPANYVEPI